MKKIFVVTGTRAEYGIYRSMLSQITAEPSLELYLIAMGMHFSKIRGYTVNEIEKDGYDIVAKIPPIDESDFREAMAKNLGNYIMQLALVLSKHKPDLIMILGDRVEMLAAASAATYLRIPIAHIHGGEISGNVDDPVRHAITKLSHLHFVATKESARRVIKMGEEPWRVVVTGAPSLDAIIRAPRTSRERICKQFGIAPSAPLLLVVHHPVVGAEDTAMKEISEIMEAVILSKLQTIVIYPNSDAGGNKMIDELKKYEHVPLIKTYPSVSYPDYLGLMQIASVMVGNSSSGIIEAPCFGLPFINIGSRQKNRQRGKNVIDVNANHNDIIAAINYALNDKRFRDSIRHAKNPYGDGNASRRIVDYIANLKLNDELNDKRMTY